MVLKTYKGFFFEKTYIKALTKTVTCYCGWAWQIAVLPPFLERTKYRQCRVDFSFPVWPRISEKGTKPVLDLAVALDYAVSLTEATEQGVGMGNDLNKAEHAK